MIGGLRLDNTAPPAPDGNGVAFVRPHEFRVQPAGAAGIAATVRRIAHTGALAAVECVAADRVVEVTLAEVPAGLAPGGSVTLVPTTVRAYPA